MSASDEWRAALGCIPMVRRNLDDLLATEMDGVSLAQALDDGAKAVEQNVILAAAIRDIDRVAVASETSIEPGLGECIDRYEMPTGPLHRALGVVSGHRHTVEQVIAWFIHVRLGKPADPAQGDEWELWTTEDGFVPLRSVDPEAADLLARLEADRGD